MNITIQLTTPQARALRHTIARCIHLAEQSPNIAAVLDLDRGTIEQVRKALENIPDIHTAHGERAAG